MVARIVMMLGCCAGVGAVGLAFKSAIYSQKELIKGLKNDLRR